MCYSNTQPKRLSSEFEPRNQTNSHREVQWVRNFLKGVAFSGAAAVAPQFAGVVYVVGYRRFKPKKSVRATPPALVGFQTCRARLTDRTPGAFSWEMLVQLQRMALCRVRLCSRIAPFQGKKIAQLYHSALLALGLVMPN